MIPDDAVLIVRQEAVTVVAEERGPELVVYAAESGFPGILDREALAHVYDEMNPHDDGVENIKLPAGHGGKWFKLGASAVEITEERPLYPEDIHPVVSEDGLVRTDASGPNRTLADLAVFPLWIGGVCTIKHPRRDPLIAPQP